MPITPVIAVGREEAIYVKTSGTGQGVNVTTFVTASALYHIGEASFVQTDQLEPNAERRASRTRLKPINIRAEPGAWSFSTYLKTSSTPGVSMIAPEVGPLMLAGWGSQVTSIDTKISTGGNTVSTFNLSSTIDRTNTAIMVLKGTGSTFEHTWITSQAATVGGARFCRVSPELATAPSTVGTTVLGSVTYKLVATNPGDVGVLKNQGHSSFRYTGCTVNQTTLNVGADGIAEAQFGGEYMREYRTGSDMLAAAITGGSAVTTTVQGSAFRFEGGADGGAGSIIKIDNEVIAITSDPTTAGNMQGMTRGIKGTTATTHVISSLITPWVPSSMATSRGTVTPGWKGYVQLQGTNLEVLDISWTLSNNITYKREKTDQRFVIAFSTPSMRDVSGAITACFRTQNIEHFRDAKDQINKELITPIGHEIDGRGRMISIQCKQVNFASPALGGDAEIEESIDITAFGDPAKDNDEIRVAWLALAMPVLTGLTLKAIALLEVVSVVV